jgi:hypothetical protein
MELQPIFRVAGTVTLLAGLLGAQDRPEPPPLENTGKPILLPFQCTDDDIQWAGLSCSAEEPCPVYLELTAVEAIGTKLFTAGNIHAQTITLYAVLLGSDDSGHSWREVHQRIRGAGLDRLQFADFENGWASGEALSPLPQDPFLLLTSDGGKTWRQHAIFSESRVGTVPQIWFASKKEGALVFDHGAGAGNERYERYESNDAGETWNIKEARSQPIRLNYSAAPALWRVQADGKTQSFRIEHQEGTRWTPAASFAVNLGACAPAQFEPKPPPEVAPEAPADRERGLPARKGRPR